MKLETYITEIHHGSQSGKVENLQVILYHDGTEVQLDIALEIPLEADTNEAVAQELRKIGQALIRASEQPSTLLQGNPPTNGE